MAVQLNSLPTSFNEHPKPIARQAPFPWDKDHLFLSLGTPSDTGVITAYGYAKNSPVAYVGQTIEVVDVASGTVGFYQIKDTNGTLEQVGSKLIGIGDADDDSKGWTGAKIKDFVEQYVEEHGGGGSYVPPTIGFTGLSTSIVEVGTQFSLTTFGFNVSNPANIQSGIHFTQGQYSFDLEKSEIQTSNVLNVIDFSNSGGGILSIAGSADTTIKSYPFTAVCTDRNGEMTVSGMFSIKGCYHAYFGRSTSQTITAEGIISDNLVAATQNGRVLCSAGQYDVTITTSANDYIWICIPNGMQLNKIMMNGFDVTDTFTRNLTPVSSVLSHTGLSRSNYSCYRSDKQSANTVTLSITLS